MPSPTALHAESVRAHYADLARSYSGGANRVCEAAYRKLVHTHTRDAAQVLEIGCGAMPSITACDAPVRIGSDFSFDMLGAARAGGITIPIVQADGARLPYGDESFDAVVTINLLEHVPNALAVLEEAARVLRIGGTFLAVTPNGNLAWLLELLEKLHLKLPEGPHRFLTQSDLRTFTPKCLEVLEHQPCLAFPAGPAWFTGLIEDMAPFGLFQSLIARRTF